MSNQIGRSCMSINIDNNTSKKSPNHETFSSSQNPRLLMEEGEKMISHNLIDNDKVNWIINCTHQGIAQK